MLVKSELQASPRNRISPWSQINYDAVSHAQSSEMGLRHSNRKVLQTKQPAHHAFSPEKNELSNSEVLLAASSVFFESYACKIKKHYVNTKSTDAFNHDVA